MAEEQTQAAPEAQPQEVHTETPTPHEVDWKAEARKWEARAKENKGKADKLDKLEEASKTALERATERAQAAEEKVKAYEQEAQRKQWLDEVAADTGLPAAVLRGNTREEIEAHANALKPFFEKPSAPVVENDKMNSNTAQAGKSEADAFFDLVQQKLN